MTACRLLKYHVVFWIALAVLVAVVPYAKAESEGTQDGPKHEQALSFESDCAHVLWQKLQSLADPELDIGLVDLGVLRRVSCDVRSNTNTITIVPTTPLCPYLKDMVADIKAVSKELFPQREAKVVVDMTTRWNPSFMTKQGKDKFWGMTE